LSIVSRPTSGPNQPSQIPEAVFKFAVIMKELGGDTSIQNVEVGWTHVDTAAASSQWSVHTQDAMKTYIGNGINLKWRKFKSVLGEGKLSACRAGRVCLSGRMLYVYARDYEANSSQCHSWNRRHDVKCVIYSKCHVTSNKAKSNLHAQKKNFRQGAVFVIPPVFLLEERVLRNFSHHKICAEFY
jgi:hypothetical protein